MRAHLFCSLSVRARLLINRRWARPILLFLFLVATLGRVTPAESASRIAPPSLVSPNDNDVTTTVNYPPLGLPEFTWSPVPDATSYRIEFANNIGFTGAFSFATANTRYTPTDVNQFSDGTWYWHVKVEAPNGSQNSYNDSPRRFTKQWASSANRPTLSAPNDSATIDFYDSPVFTWQPVPGAASYKLQIANNSGFSSPIDLPTIIGTTFQPQSKTANGTWYWRVVPVDPANREGTPSDTRQFTQSYNYSNEATLNRVPTLLEPADDSTPTFTPTFKWTAVRGAQSYDLQYSTDPYFGVAGTVIGEARNTTFTPTSALPNDVNYYWRVRAKSGSSTTDWTSDWSPAFSFIKRWYLVPTLLTPTNNYLYTTEPFFSWTPVAGAKLYRIEVSQANSFNPVVGGFTATTVNPFFVKAEWGWETDPDQTWWWRVIPIDSGGYDGRPSNVFSFVDPAVHQIVPRQTYPFYFYLPDSLIQPHEDRTVAFPIFSWHRLLTGTSGGPSGDPEVSAYCVQVSASPGFSPLAWRATTGNYSAAPTQANPFNPVADTNYYWRVGVTDAVTDDTAPCNVSAGKNWSQVWLTRFNSNRALAVQTLTLLRPVNGAESVEMGPLFEWKPYQGATYYEIQIDDDPGFGSSSSFTVPYTAYAPKNRLNVGTYYWRVRAHTAGGNQPWSGMRRFQVAAQSQWRETRTLANVSNRISIGTDPGGDTGSSYDLTTLNVSQDSTHWYFGFNANGTSGMVYGLYIDEDHKDNSGASSDPLGLSITTISAHRPEYVIYFVPAGSFGTDNTWIYHWTPSGWDLTIPTLADVGGTLSHNSTTKYLEIQVPSTAINMNQDTGSMSISLFSAPSGGPNAVDSVPSDPNVPGSGGTTVLSRFGSVSERFNMAVPPSSTGGDPSTWPSVPPFLWHVPANVPWKGYHIQFATDSGYTSNMSEFTVSGDSMIPGEYTYVNSDLNGDNTYYWRLKPVYAAWGDPQGAWSEPTAFVRSGMIPNGLTQSISYATPTFSWNSMEGVESYDIQVDTASNFPHPDFSTITGMTTTTPYPNTLPNATYYWRVRAHRVGVTNNWSPPVSFNLSLPLPTNLHLTNGTTTNRAPTFCWDSPPETRVAQPVLSAFKYRLQVSFTDPTFSSPYESIDTEQNCWTPSRGYDDGTYYWRVAMIDGSGYAGAYSPAVSFTKQYSVPALISPANSSAFSGTPTFEWSSVNGSAAYELQVATDNLFNAIYDGTITTNNTRYTPTKTYTSQRYYWRLRMKDKDSKYGPWTNAILLPKPLENPVFLPLTQR